MPRKNKTPAHVAIAVCIVGIPLALAFVFGVVSGAMKERKARDELMRLRMEEERERLVAFNPNGDWAADRELLAALEAESEAERAEMKAAVTDPLPPESPDVAEFAPLFRSLGRALNDKDLAAVNKHCDLDRLLDEIIRLGGGREWPGGLSEFRRDFGTANAEWQGTQLLTEKSTNWDRVEVRRVQWSADRREAVLVAYHHHAADTLRMRWWVVRRTDGWKIYDSSGLRMPLRSSVHLAHSVLPSVIVYQNLNPGRYEAATKALAEAEDVFSKQGAVAAEALLSATRDVPLSEQHRVLLAVYDAQIHLSRNEFDAALARLDEAERLIPNTPSVRDWRALALNTAARYEEALVVLRASRADFGATGRLWCGEGYALEGLERRAEALQAYRRSLDETPNEIIALHGLRRTLPANEKQELADRLGKTHDPRKAYDQLASQARGDNDTAGADALLDGLLNVKPDDSRAMGDDIRRKVKQEKYTEATAILKRGLNAKSSTDRDSVFHAYLYAMLGADKSLDAYAAMPATLADRAFRSLAEDLEDEIFEDEDEPDKQPKQVKQLTELIAAHRKQSPNDAWLWYFDGTLLQHAKQYDKAEQAFAAGAEKYVPRKPDPDDPDEPGERDWEADRFRSRRVTCLFKLKKGLDAYRDVGPANDTFRQLARLYDMEKDYARLEKLIAAHAGAATPDPERTYWQAHILYAKQEYTKAVPVFRKYLTESDEKAPSRWAARNELIRSLLRSKPADAKKAISDLGPDKVNFALQAAVAAATDDLAELERLLAESTKHGGKTWFYSDEDFRRFINDAKYRDLREKYPNPNPPPKLDG